MPLDPDNLAICISTLFSDPLSHIDMDELDRVAGAAAEAGFAGVSWWTLHHVMLTGAGATDAQIAAVFDRHHLDVRAVEAVTTWATAPTRRDAVLADATGAFEVAGSLGAEQVLAVTMDPILPPQAAEGLGLVADRAAARGLELTLEFLPWSGIPDLRAAWDLVRNAGRDNVHLCLDPWHWQRQPGGPDWETLREIPGERIGMVQLDDAAEPTGRAALDETMDNRLPPGEGVIDLPALLKGLETIGADPLVCPEVFNTELRDQGPDALAKRVMAGCRTVIEGAG